MAKKKDNKERVEVVGSNTHAAITITFSSFWKKKTEKAKTEKSIWQAPTICVCLHPDIRQRK